MKYYAVKTGKTPGIYEDWETCKEQVEGYPGAKYKSFKTKEEAERFIGLVSNTNASSKQDSKTDVPYAFVDGSYNPETKVYGCGGYLFFKGKYYLIQGSGSGPEASMRNVAGEILGACKAIATAASLKIDGLKLYYDYAGIENWVTGVWKCNNEWTRKYKEYVRKYIDAGLEITFVHTKGHSGIAGNELVDRLAKLSVGIVEQKVLDEIEELKKKLGIIS